MMLTDMAERLAWARAAYIEDLLVQAVALQDFDRIDDLVVVDDPRLWSVTNTDVSVASLVDPKARKAV